MVSEKDTGYMISFSVCTGSECNDLVQRNATMDTNCSKTTKAVMGLLDAGNLLDMHRQVWFDNWLNSVELLLEVLVHNTCVTETVTRSH